MSSSLLSFHLRGLLPVVTAAVLFAACGDSSEPETPVNPNPFPPIEGCAQPAFPSEQPDLALLHPPVFPLTTPAGMQNSVGQSVFQPGDLIDAGFGVDGQTRFVRAELTSNRLPPQVIDTQEFETAGSEVFKFQFVSNVNNVGRYYMAITLCADDCNAQQIVYAPRACTSDPADTEPCGTNGTYERSIVEGGVVVQQDTTCFGFGTEPNVGSGTVLIQ